MISILRITLVNRNAFHIKYLGYAAVVKLEGYNCYTVNLQDTHHYPLYKVTYTL